MTQTPDARRFVDTALHMLRGSGLDTGEGDAFIQQRLALFARIIAVIAFAFLVLGVGLAAGLAHQPLLAVVTGSDTLALLAGCLFITALWLVCRGRRLPLPALGAIDAAGLIGCCTAWAFFVKPGSFESVHAVMMALTLTVLTRAIVVPSKAARTLRLGLIALVAPMVMVWRMTSAMGGAGHGLVVTGYQLLWALAAVALATIASRVIYGLRKSVREANELGSYTLEERLGAGGMGEVWRARHRYLARPAAIKLIRRQPADGSGGDSEVLLRRFEREARATAALRSPHTVQLYDFGQAQDGTLFYVMELLVGVDLETLVSRYGPIPAERAVHILRQVLSSLEEAHQNGLTHRDIKPANIFVSGVGGEVDFVKVLDFGLVRLSQERPAAEQVKLTHEGTANGTPAYMAPEIVLGDRGYDHRVDLYSVGCVAYWLLTGTLVFEAESAMKMMVDHARKAPAPPQTRTELPIPPDLEQAIMDCLEKDPARRPASAAALSQRLATVKAPSEWTAERAAGWWRVHLPQQAQARSVAEVLMSHEASPGGIRELRRMAR